MEWLCRAQDVVPGGGVSMGWFLKEGWRPPYPETTGYIIPTFLEYAALTDNAVFTERAVRMGTWELSVAFGRNSRPSGQPRISVGF